LANVQLPYRVVSIKKRRGRPYFILKIFIDSTENYDLYKKYVAAAKKQNDVIDKYKNGNTQATYFDAGFDLFCPDLVVISDSRTGSAVHKVNHMVKCSMMKVDYDADGEKFVHPVGYYMYPRSSTGTKTPLRLANSVGIIDSGYRGHIIAAFDAPPSFSCTGGEYKVEQFQRLVQICPPDLSYPIDVELVADESLLGCGGQRGTGGFGSTGT
jgi:dUTP pyrophosphatase